MDDFAVACADRKMSKEIIEDINNQMTIEIKELGLLDRFNGTDIDQTREYIKLHNTTYINKIISHHPWLQSKQEHIHTLPLPMRADPPYLRELETAEPAQDDERNLLEKEYHFKYRQGIGEIIYAMVTCRPDISFPVIKLAQYSTKPARIHFEAVKHLYKYLAATKTEGIYYWRKTKRHDLKPGIIPKCNDNLKHMTSDELQETIPNPQVTPHILETAVDSDHAGDTTHRKSVTGIIHRLAGGTVHYKTKYTDIIPQSSTEAEFIAAVEAGKQILYLRSILDEINMPQESATVLYEDNQGALLMANAQQPTKRSRHMDIKNFALQDWVKRDLILLKRISTKNNYSDAMTKSLQRILFYRHMNYISGKYIPDYAKQTRQTQCIKKVCFNLGQHQNKPISKHGMMC